ncbi:MAG: hypothetical protein ABIQ90_12845 [Polaromonas sp.]
MLKNLLRRLQKISNAKNFGVLLVAYGLYTPVFFFADVPFGLIKIKPHAQGSNILDVELFYSAEQAYQRLALFGAPGRAVYYHILMGDLIYPALLGGLLSVSITWLFRRLNFSGAYWPCLGLLPLVNMAFDYTEDALLLTLLANYPAQLPWIATAAGLATLSKNIFGMLSFLVLGLGLLALLFRKFSVQRA